MEEGGLVSSHSKYSIWPFTTSRRAAIVVWCHSSPESLALCRSHKLCRLDARAAGYGTAGTPRGSSSSQQGVTDASVFETLNASSSVAVPFVDSSCLQRVAWLWTRLFALDMASARAGPIVQVAAAFHAEARAVWAA